jgi:hypothetical protein
VGSFQGQTAEASERTARAELAPHEDRPVVPRFHRDTNIFGFLPCCSIPPGTNEATVAIFNTTKKNVSPQRTSQGQIAGGIPKNRMAHGSGTDSATDERVSTRRLFTKGGTTGCEVSDDNHLNGCLAPGHLIAETFLARPGPRISYFSNPD